MKHVSHVTINARRVPVVGENHSQLVQAPKFLYWASQISEVFDVKGIAARATVFLPNGQLLFAFLDCEIYRLDGSAVPGIIFLRGDAVVMLVVLVSEETGERYTVVLKQGRFPIGDPNLGEIPAGMRDDALNLTGVAAKEIKEEVGFVIRPETLLELGEFFPSPGGSDEKLTAYVSVTSMPQAQIDEMKGRVTGNLEENEQITVDVIPLFQLPKVCSRDGKSLTAFFLYLQANPKIMVEYAVWLRNEQVRQL